MFQKLAKQLVEQVKAKDLFAAMKTLALILDKAGDTGKLLFGAAEAGAGKLVAVEHSIPYAEFLGGSEDVDLTAEYEELKAVRGELMRSCSCGDGSCVVTTATEGEAKNIGLWITLLDVVLKIIEMRRNK